MKFVDIGFGNLAATARIVTVASPDTAPIKRLCQEAKDEGRVIDVSCGQKTRSVIVTDCGLVLLSPLETGALAERLAAAENT
ncbi:MAG: DUF370 domain-containing protein [Clostridia bacterium]|nr:DUF370 domain-containing protein [Clostridia bacterium]